MTSIFQPEFLNLAAGAARKSKCKRNSSEFVARKLSICSWDPGARVLPFQQGTRNRINPRLKCEESACNGSRLLGIQRLFMYHEVESTFQSFFEGCTDRLHSV